MAIQIGQVVVEVALRPPQTARVGQLAVEIALDNTLNTGPVRVTQVATEALEQASTTATVRVSEIAPETLLQASTTGRVRVTQVVIEVLQRFLGCEPPPEPCPTVHEYGCPVDLPLVPVAGKLCVSGLPLAPTVVLPRED